ncbi:spexin prohormone 2-like [Pelobates fuscus]|uniref:spexin prohormone 2-like n=1 Tax=Pelobates fuscus TaxID=191477 RepID=UPI002FE4588E
MSRQRAISWVFGIFVMLLVTDCRAAVQVFTGNWGPQSMLYLKGKHGRRNTVESEGEFSGLALISWTNYINSLIGYQKSKQTLEQLFKKDF